MNFRELIQETSEALWPFGEAENLVGVHRKFFIEALYQIQRAVPCLQQNNTSVFAHCASYFNCGMTVLPAPRGHILKVYTLDSEPVADGATASPQLKFINPAASIAVSAETIGTTVSKAYTINPSEGTVINVQGVTQGVGTAFSMTATVRITPTDGSADTIEKVYTVTDSFLNVVPEALLDEAEADAYTVEIVLALTGLSGNSSQWVQQARAAEIVLSYYQTGATPLSPPDWCGKVEYSQVDYCHIQRYVKLCEKCSSSPIVTDALLTALFGVCRTKTHYPAPTDAGLESLPALPGGFHYPQSSTDASGRACGGVYALYRGRIYIAPWIQSTETVVIEINGIKREWNDDDLIDDDPLLKQAVRLHVGMQHSFAYEADQTQYNNYKAEFYGNAEIPGVLPTMIHECREENRAAICGESGSMAAGARGLGQSAEIFTNDRQEYTATCPVGQSGNQVTVVVEAGAIGSALSVADANARAAQKAADDANAKLVCVTPVITYLNTVQSVTVSCPGANEDVPAADGNPVTVTIAAGQYSSTASQSAADAAALAAATAQANTQLVCTFWNSEQEYTASCISPATGSDVTITVAAHTHSATTQALADSLALTDAINQANEALTCSTPPTVYWNTQQQGSYVGGCSYSPGGQIQVIVTVPALRFSSIVSQNAANIAARNAGNAAAQQAFPFYCRPGAGNGPFGTAYPS